MSGYMDIITATEDDIDNLLIDRRLHQAKQTEKNPYPGCSIVDEKGDPSSIKFLISKAIIKRVMDPYSAGGAHSVVIEDDEWLREFLTKVKMSLLESAPLWLQQSTNSGAGFNTPVRLFNDVFTVVAKERLPRAGVSGTRFQDRKANDLTAKQVFEDGAKHGLAGACVKIAASISSVYRMVDPNDNTQKTGWVLQLDWVRALEGKKRPREDPEPCPF